MTSNSKKPETADAPSRRCAGRTGKYWTTRCKKRVFRGLYCPSHRSQWFAAILALVGALFTLFGMFSAGVTVYAYFRPESKDEAELRRDVYSDISLAVHGWKHQYLMLNPSRGSLLNGNSGVAYSSIWARLMIEELPSYSVENWRRYHPLFNARIDEVDRRLQSILAAHSDMLTASMRNLIGDTRSSLYACQVG